MKHFHTFPAKLSSLTRRKSAYFILAVGLLLGGFTSTELLRDAFARSTTDVLINPLGGNVGIGNTNPDTTLHVTGQFKLVDGTEGANKVLTSDANGLASWNTLAGGAGDNHSLDAADGSPTDALFVNNDGNVGIGMTTPVASLEVQGNFSQQISGNVTVPATAVDVTGVGTLFTQELQVGDALLIAGETMEVESIQNDTMLVLTTAHPTGALNVPAFTGNDILALRDAAGAEKLVMTKNGKVVIGSDSAPLPLEIAANDGVLLTGTFGSGTIPAEGVGTRLMWYPGKAAFRVGRIAIAGGSTAWDDSNIGPGSAAFGGNTIASGDSAIAMGSETIASGERSVAMGFGSTASGFQTVAMGIGTTASGNQATAMGIGTTAAGDNSVAMGNSTTASGDEAVAMGNSTTASGVRTVATGTQTTAQAQASLVGGRWNVITGSGGSWHATDPLFVLGNGTNDANRNNAFTVLKNGNATLAGTLTQNSDRTLKKNISLLQDSLQNISSLRGVSFEWKNTQTHPAGNQLGLIAQEVAAVYPELVGSSQSGHKTVNYAALVAPLIEAVKELKSWNQRLQEDNTLQDEQIARLRIDNQEKDTEIAKLKQRLQALEQKFDLLHSDSL